MNKKRILLIVLMAALMVLLISTVGFAATSNPGINFGNWLQKNVGGIFIGILAVVAIGLFIKRQLMQAVIVIVFAGLASLFIFGGTGFAQKMANLISSWF